MMLQQSGSSGPQFAVVRPRLAGTAGAAPPSVGRLWIPAANSGASVPLWGLARVASIMNTKGTGYRFFQKTRFGRTLAKTFWRTVTMIAEMHAGYSKSPNAKKLRPLPHGNGYVRSTLFA